MALKFHSRLGPLKHGVYFYILESSWLETFYRIIVSYLALNLFFAGLFFLFPDSVAGKPALSFADDFFFSVQTFSTIGYGALSPHSLIGNWIVTCEVLCSLFFSALVTGLVFTKFAIPRASILFSKRAVIKKMEGVPTLLFRMGNSRGNDIAEAQAHVTVLVDHVTVEGDRYRKMHDLKLVRNRTAFFRLTWTVMHQIDEASPLSEYLNTRQINFVAIIISVNGHDSTFNAQIYTRYQYNPEDILLNQMFSDVISEGEDGILTVDYTKFHDVVPVDAVHQLAGF